MLSPARLVLLLQDGHESHVSIELIEFARDNGVHLAGDNHSQFCCQGLAQFLYIGKHTEQFQKVSINPGAVSDRQLAPSKAVGASTKASVPEFSVPVFTAEEEATYWCCFTEGYDLPDSNNSACVKLNHPGFSICHSV